MIVVVVVLTNLLSVCCDGCDAVHSEDDGNYRVKVGVVWMAVLSTT